MDRYSLLIPRPLKLRLDAPPRRRPRAPAAVEATLRSESAFLYDAAVGRGLVSPTGGEDEVDDDDAPVVVEEEEADEAEAEADGEEDRMGDMGDVGDRMTAAERRHAKAVEERERARLAALAEVSYKERVDGFNKSLAKQPAHNDIFKTSHTKG